MVGNRHGGVLASSKGGNNIDSTRALRVTTAATARIVEGLDSRFGNLPPDRLETDPNFVFELLTKNPTDRK